MLKQEKSLWKTLKYPQSCFVSFTLPCNQISYLNYYLKIFTWCGQKALILIFYLFTYSDLNPFKVLSFGKVFYLTMLHVTWSQRGQTSRYESFKIICILPLPPHGITAVWLHHITYFLKFLSTWEVVGCPFLSLPTFP